MLVLGNKICCAFTIARDENILLPIWLKYYSKHFDPNDIYVFDHNSIDGTIEKLLDTYDFNVIRLEHPYHNDATWYNNQIRKSIAEFLREYRKVLFAKPNEIVMHATRPLDEYLRDVRNFYSDQLCSGWSIIQKQEESPFDSCKSILSQRKYWFHNTACSIQKIFSNQDKVDKQIQPHINSSLLNIDIARLDYIVKLERNKTVLTYQWIDQPTMGIEESYLGDEFRKWFYDNLPGEIEEIPGFIRDGFIGAGKFF